ncbi:hypothetical protein [Paenibacillus ginsengarvi]|uniref:Tissue inhibitor of metalloproteinase n=1 Tax=Paenibacillus ginsengarvi TaxID=400777 RepID=A0A3B0B260_9BACL|nr:hypothetical protein [Paenibacillus ginsengarvi]RKN66084.1 hypothetical protein D7M11_31250 [Paenibacillus ginsengarvi]
MRTTIVWMLIVLLSAGIVFSLAPAPASACSCAGPAPVQEELNRKTAVFSGKVTGVAGPNRGFIRSSADPVRITFEVGKVWKGELLAQTDVYTASSSASCGYDSFAVGKEYIVYASTDKDQLVTGLCSRTKLLTAAGEDLQALGNGYGPLPGKSGPTRNVPLTADIAAVVVLLAAAVSFLVTRKRRRSS